MNIEEMADEIISNLSIEDREYISNMEEKELISLHHNLGRDIRNRFKLWTLKWEPYLIDGVDHSHEHPDAVSQKVVETIWKKLKNHVYMSNS